ncbi:hypothetical protein ACIQCT_16705 [Enterobacter cancerogenus]|uniref:hypothetical protein n=1 Tax=Enterobacter cancerogenus TaxID=69218 RepID=UPI00382AFEFA
MLFSRTPKDAKADSNTGLTLFWIVKVILAAVAFYFLQILFKFMFDKGRIDYLFVFIIGVVLSSIELGSRYRDEPVSVMTCLPGAFYLIVNGIICCIGLFFIHTFGMSKDITKDIEVEKVNEFSTMVINILYASLGSFFIMRSSFLKLGSENSQSQIDLGLNLILKKMIDMIDRQVDRDQARRRSKDITEILKNVSYESLSARIHPFCLQVMQNISEEELGAFFKEIEVINSSDTCDDTKKMAIGLQLYNIIGSRLFASIVEDLGVSSTPPPEQPRPRNEFNDSFGGIVEQVKSTSS